MFFMSEIELEELKKRLLSEYRSNGGRKDLDGFSASQIMNEIDHLREITKLQNQIKTLKVNDENTSQTKGIQFSRINKGRVNAQLAREVANTMGRFIDYLDEPWDPRSIEDERYKRDNEVIRDDGGIPGYSVILRDKHGRMA